MNHLKIFKAGTVTDIDGNDYKTVKIGNQRWMAENLNVRHFRNGDPIPEAKTENEWAKAAYEIKSAWCYYVNEPENGKIYGKLYNWHAVNDPRGLAPRGWYIPADKEWTQLTDYLGGEEIAGDKMREKFRWAREDNSNNESGFTGLPGGYRNYCGLFHLVGYTGHWWSSSEYDTDFAWYRYLISPDNLLLRHSYYKQSGFSVRCIRDE